MADRLLSTKHQEESKDPLKASLFGSLLSFNGNLIDAYYKQTTKNITQEINQSENSNAQVKMCFRCSSLIEEVKKSWCSLCKNQYCRYCITRYFGVNRCKPCLVLKGNELRSQKVQT